MHYDNHRRWQSDMAHGSKKFALPSRAQLFREQGQLWVLCVDFTCVYEMWSVCL